MGVLFPEVDQLNSCSIDGNFALEDIELLKKASGNEELIKVIGKYGKNSFRQTALYAAVYYNDTAACEVLVRHGAFVSSEMLSYAKQRHYSSTLKVLLETKPAAGPTQYQFILSKKEYLFSTEFEIDSDQIEPAKISKPKVAVKTYYELEGSQGFCARGSVRILSMGSLFAWGKDIDVYDDKGDYLGMIDGEALTTAEAKFSFFDAGGNKVAIAYLDDNKTGFTIVHPYNNSRVIARLTREFIPHIPDPWKVRVYQGQDVDQRLLQIFAAFAVDSSSSFLKDG